MLALDRLVEEPSLVHIGATTSTRVSRRLVVRRRIVAAITVAPGSASLASASVSIHAHAHITLNSQEEIARAAVLQVVRIPIGEGEVVAARVIVGVGDDCVGAWVAVDPGNVVAESGAVADGGERAVCGCEESESHGGEVHDG